MKLSIIILCFGLGVLQADVNPDINLDVPGLIKKYGYPVESHTVTTEDGYILTLHRIPHGRKGDAGMENRVRGKQPVFLQHGLLASSACWIMACPERAPAYLFADGGYDVWMGNARGNHYSRNHTHLSPLTKKFWDFRWVYYDLPAVVDYILSNTDYPNLSYVGHSMGTTMFFAFLSRRPEYTDKIKVMFALAPVAEVAHIRSPIRHLSPYVKDFEFLYNMLGKYEFLPHSSKFVRWAEQKCISYYYEEVACLNAIFLLTGFDVAQFNMTWMPAIFSHTPEGTSVRTIVHYAQGVNTAKFQQYDFGVEENKKRYGQVTPPAYSLSNVKVPVAIFRSKNDYLADPQDVKWLSKHLGNVALNIEVPLPLFNHVDFIWGIDAYRYIYRPILKYLPHF